MQYAMMMPGPWELGLVLMILVLLFGAGKLPSVLKDLGQGLRELKHALREGDEVEEEVKKAGKDIKEASK